MALTWDWNKRIGRARFWNGNEEVILNLYQGNAFLIFMKEFYVGGARNYELWSFFADKKHAKNCLGLDKEWNRNIFSDGGALLHYIEINTREYAYTKDLVQLLTKAYKEITIKLYYR